MQALILCAGYATRMYPLTKNKPKSLLPVAGKPLLEHIITKLAEVREIEKILIVSNGRFLSHFKTWQKNYQSKKEISILCDGSTSVDTRMGAVGDIRFAIEDVPIDDNLMVVGGDNLFTFNLNPFIEFFREKGISIAVHNVKRKELIKRYNEIELDDHCRVVNFVEKPAHPKNTLAGICLYLFPKNKLKLINEYIEEGNNPDQPGRYIQWLYQKVDVFGYFFSERWFDIGDAKQYRKANVQLERQ